jgi:hypothetical protein
LDTACTEGLCERPVGLKKITAAALNIAADHDADHSSLDLTRLFETSMIDGRGMTYYRELLDTCGWIGIKMKMRPKTLEAIFNTFSIKGVVDYTRRGRQTNYAIYVTKRPVAADPNVAEWTNTQEIKTESSLQGKLTANPFRNPAATVQRCGIPLRPGPPRTLVSDQSRVSSDMTKNDMRSQSTSVLTDCVNRSDRHYTSMNDKLSTIAEQKRGATFHPQSPAACRRAFDSSSKSCNMISCLMDDNIGDLDENLQVADPTRNCGMKIGTHELDVIESPHQRAFAATFNLDSDEKIDTDAVTTASFARVTANVLEEVEVHILPVSIHGARTSEAQIAHTARHTIFAPISGDKKDQVHITHSSVHHETDTHPEPDIEAFLCPSAHDPLPRARRPIPAVITSSPNQVIAARDVGIVCSASQRVPDVHPYALSVRDIADVWPKPLDPGADLHPLTFRVLERHHVMSDCLESAQAEPYEDQSSPPLRWSKPLRRMNAR